MNILIAGLFIILTIYYTVRFFEPEPIVILPQQRPQQQSLFQDPGPEPISTSTKRPYHHRAREMRQRPGVICARLPLQSNRRSTGRNGVSWSFARTRLLSLQNGPLELACANRECQCNGQLATSTSTPGKSSANSPIEDLNVEMQWYTRLPPLPHPRSLCDKAITHGCNMHFRSAHKDTMSAAGSELICRPSVAPGDRTRSWRHCPGSKS